MDKKATSAIIAVGIWLAVVMFFCALWIRDGIRDAATAPSYAWELQEIQRQLADLNKSTACLAWHAEFETATRLNRFGGLGPNPC